MLEVQLTPEESPRALAIWSAAAREMTEALGWHDTPVASRTWSTGAELGIAAPTDQLFTATEVNEWAWLQAAVAIGRDLGPPSLTPGDTPRDPAAATRHLLALARVESDPPLRALEQAAQERGAPFRWDDDTVWLGSGCHAASWPRSTLPSSAMVDWPARRGVPTAIITGSNGKTTTTRLLTAILAAHGLRTGYSSTDGVFVNGMAIAEGDYSGPAGALRVLADPSVQAAVLETARGAILRRGLVIAEADVAVVTNIQFDHFGEYGIENHAAIARVKLTVAKGLRDDGWLVLNAGDAELMAAESGVRAEVRRAWFALDPANLAGRDGTRSATILDGQLVVNDGTATHPLVDINSAPLAAGGAARYNLENIMAATLAAVCLGVPVATIRRVITTFGADPADNPGRLEIWRLGEITVLTDYAHNPEGITGLLRVARTMSPSRLILLLGQAGNRTDDSIRALAAAAMAFRPDHVVLKDLGGYLRGRAEGEVPGILAGELRRLGLPGDRMEVVLPEVTAVRRALERGLPGDVLVLPVHALEARAEVASLLRQLSTEAWHPGSPLP